MNSRVDSVLVMVVLKLSLATGLTIDIDSNFSCGKGSDFTCEGNATTTSTGLLKLTPDPPDRNQTEDFYFATVGVALYREPLQVLIPSTNQTASFSTSFSFEIEPRFLFKNETTGKTAVAPGDGMAFVMLDKPIWIGGAGGSLGVYSFDGPRTLAVEFDTFQNVFDSDSNHVGIDVESITSRIARNAGDLNITMFYTMDRMFAWIDYDASASILEVRINETNGRPAEAFISYPLHLSDIFDQDLVWVGFSGSNGLCNCHNYYTVHDWKFSSSFPTPPAPAPTTRPSMRPSPPPDPPYLTPPKMGTKSSRANKRSIGRGVFGGMVVLLLLLCGRF